MKTKFFKVATVSAVAIFLMAMVIGNASGFGLKDLTGGKKKENVDIDSLVDNQNNLCKRLYTALAEINKAQGHFVNATGKKEAMEKVQQNAKLIEQGNFEDSKAIAEIRENTEAINELLEKWSKKEKVLDEAKKKEIEKGLVPYAKGTANTVILGKDFADHLKSTKTAIKQAGLSKAGTIKKKLGVTLSVAPKVPGLGSDLMGTSKTLIGLARKNKLNTKKPEEIIGDIDI